MKFHISQPHSRADGSNYNMHVNDISCFAMKLLQLPIENTNDKHIITMLKQILMEYLYDIYVLTEIQQNQEIIVKCIVILLM